MADISDGAKRLAQELDQYITRGPDKTGQGNAESGSALSDDAIADLQLATARKLREVGQLCELFKIANRAQEKSGNFGLISYFHSIPSCFQTIVTSFI